MEKKNFREQHEIAATGSFLNNERLVDFMTKAELMKEFDELEKEKGVRIEGIYYNSKKSEIQNAIECLKCPDEMLDKYLILVSLKYPNSGRIIAENGDFKRHSFNRLYVYNTARMILANQASANGAAFRGSIPRLALPG